MRSLGPFGPFRLYKRKGSKKIIMPITREKKKEIEEKLLRAIKDAASLVFVHFKGLSVSDTRDLRTALRSEGIGYTVAKKSLMRRAFEKSGVAGEIPELDGEIALAYGADPIAPARGVFEFQKKFKEQIAIVGGVFEGVFRDKAGMVEIASIPPLQTLRGQFVNLLNSPIQQFVMALGQIAETKEVNKS